MNISKFTILLLFLTIAFTNCNKKTTNTSTDNNNNTTEPVKGEDPKDNSNNIPAGKWFVVNFPLEGKPFAPAQFYVMNFEKDKVGLSLEKNQCGSGFKYGKETINFEGFGCTEMCCDSKESGILLGLLKGELKYSMTNSTMTITTAQGEIKLKNDLGTLFNSQWKAISYADRKEGSHTKFSKPYILKFEASKIDLQLDANNCHTTCTYNDKESSFELPAQAMACTRKCCDSEDALLLMNSLQGKITYKKDQNNLVMRTFNKEIIFEPYGND